MMKNLKSNVLYVAMACVIASFSSNALSAPPGLAAFDQVKQCNAAVKASCPGLRGKEFDSCRTSAMEANKSSCGSSLAARQKAGRTSGFNIPKFDKETLRARRELTRPE